MHTYFSYNALVSQRASGYQNTQYALAELIDNAFDAGASKIKVMFFEKRDNNRRYIDEIIVCDNGKGMSQDILGTCLQFGATTHTDLDVVVAQKKKGKFGFGLPNASLSQCTNITVYSWQDGGPTFTTSLNLQELKDTQSILIPPIKKTELPPHYTRSKAVLRETSGTIVSWKNCDRLSYSRGETLCDKSRPLLGAIYRYLVSSGSSITLEVHEHNPSQNNFVKKQDFVIIPNDPLFLMENALIAERLYAAANANREYSSSYQPFSQSLDKCRPTNRKLDDHCFPFEFRWQGRTYRFSLSTSYAHLEIQKPGIREGAKTPVGEFYGNRDSISFVRAGREIASGTFSFYRKTEPQHRWWSIEVKFDADADDLLGVHNNKQGIKFVYTEADGLREEFNEFTSTLPEAREELWTRLTKHVDDAYRAAWTAVRNQGRDWDLAHKPGGNGGPPGLPAGTQTTVDATITTDGKRADPFSEEQSRLLLERLATKYPSIPQEQIEVSINRFNESRVRGCILYHASEDPSLWSMTEVYGFLIILINTNHQFYVNILAPLRNDKRESALSAIELFISSLAWEERGDHFMLPEKKAILEEYRAYVGIHLNRYIRENAISLEHEGASVGAAQDDGVS